MQRTIIAILTVWSLEKAFIHVDVESMRVDLSWRSFLHAILSPTSGSRFYKSEVLFNLGMMTIMVSPAQDTQRHDLYLWENVLINSSGKR